MNHDLHSHWFKMTGQIGVLENAGRLADSSTGTYPDETTRRRIDQGCNE
jgi:hypothetical protein